MAVPDGLCSNYGCGGNGGLLGYEGSKEKDKEKLDCEISYKPDAWAQSNDPKGNGICVLKYRCPYGFGALIAEGKRARRFIQILYCFIFRCTAPSASERTILTL